MEPSEKLVEILQEALQKNLDAEAGYLHAADKVDSVALRKWFLDESAARAKYADTLRGILFQYGISPESKTSITADLHRMWTSIRDVFSIGDHAIHEECLRGEAAYIDEYTKVLEEGQLPPNVVEVMTTHLSSVRDAYNELKNLNLINPI